MYDAYGKIEVTKLLPDSLKSLSGHASKPLVFVGLNSGSVVVYTAAGTGTCGFECAVFKGYTRKPMLLLEHVLPLERLFCLSNQTLTVHRDSTGYDVVSKFKAFAVVTAFACRVSQKTGRVFVAVSSKKQIHVFKFLANDFEEVPTVFNPSMLLENPTSICWASDYALYFSTSREYFFVQVLKNEETRQEEGIGEIRIVTACRATDGPMVTIPDHDAVGLTVQNGVVEFYDADGNAKKSLPPAKFMSTPRDMAYDMPYLAAVVDSGLVEIRSLEPSQLIQKLSVPGASHITRSLPGALFVAGEKSVFELTSRPLARENIHRLVEEKNFELASKLADAYDDLDPLERIQVKRKTAANFFAQKKFSECFAIHQKLKTDILLLLHFFPDLIPEKYGSKMRYKDVSEVDDFQPCPHFAQNDVIAAQKELISYLSEMRVHHVKTIDQHHKTKCLTTEEYKRHEGILELTDTVLLKCYLRCQPGLVSSLLRLSHNHCNIEEAAKDLRKAGRLDDLYLLYSNKRLRHKALEILETQSKKEESEYYGDDELIWYLQTLGPGHFDLIKKHAVSVLRRSPAEGVKIFANNESEQAKLLDPVEVLLFLRNECVPAVIPYLEHVINVWHSDNREFHEELIGMYINKIKKLRKNCVIVLSDDEVAPSSEKSYEDGELEEVRKKLIAFLQSSKLYDPVKVCHQLEDDKRALTHEIAVVYGRLGRHEESLLIYTNVLLAFDLAREHCLHYADENLFMLLYRAYIVPSQLPAYESIKELHPVKPNVDEALKLLAACADRMDVVEAIELLPSETPLAQIWPMLEVVMEAVRTKSTALQIQAAAARRQLASQKAALSTKRSMMFRMDEAVKCAVCMRAIGGAAFVGALRSRQFIHHACYSSLPDQQVQQRLS